MSTILALAFGDGYTSGTERGRAVLAVVAERERQVEKGWTLEHDDKHDVQHLLMEAYERLVNVKYDSGNGGESREALVVVAALLVAAIECHDRRAQGSTARGEESTNNDGELFPGTLAAVDALTRDRRTQGNV